MSPPANQRAERTNRVVPLRRRTRHRRRSAPSLPEVPCASALAPATHDFERLLDTYERRIGVAFVFDDVPLDARDVLTEAEDFRPVLFVITDERVGPGFREWLHVDAGDAARFLFQIHHGI